MLNDFLLELATFLQGAGAGTLYNSQTNPTGNLFTGQLPYEAHTGIFVVYTPGPAPHQYVDTEKILIDIWSRDSKSDVAYERLRKVYEILHRNANYPLQNWYVYFSEVTGSISDFDRDSEGGKLLKISVLFTARNLNNIS